MKNKSPVKLLLILILIPVTLLHAKTSLNVEPSAHERVNCSSPDTVLWAAEVVSVVSTPLNSPDLLTEGITCDQSGEISVTLRNVGSKDWFHDSANSNSFPAKLELARVVNNEPFAEITDDELADTQTIEINNHPVVKCNDTLTVKIPVYKDEAPSDVSQFESYWRLLISDVEGPGEVPDEIAFLAGGDAAYYSIPNLCSNQTAGCSNGITPTTEFFGANILSMDIDDELVCGLTAEVEITVQNTGELSWFNTSGTNNRIGLGTLNNSVLPGAYLPVGVEVGCGDIYTFQHQAQMPGDISPGIDISTWSMFQEGQVGFFGNTAAHQASVVCDSVTDLVPVPMVCFAGPTAYNDVASVGENEQLIFDLSANDESPEAVDYQVVITGGNCSDSGTFQHHGDGVISFIPSQGSIGQCTVNYQLSAPGYAPSLATLNIDILDAPLSQINLVVNYMPSANSTPVTLNITDELPVHLDFYYDESLGSFEHQPGTACTQPPTNPGYLSLSIVGQLNSELTSCTLNKVLDGVPTANGINCLPAFEHGITAIMDTNSLKRSQINGCGLLQDLQGLMSVGAAASFEIEFQQAGSNVFEKRQINVTKKSPQLSYPDVHHVADITARIEAEDYDIGGQNVSFFDGSAEPSTWVRAGGYEDAVDLFQLQSGQVIIRNTTAGEWTEYTRKVLQSGIYEFRIWANNSNSNDGAIPEIQIEADGMPLLARPLKITESGWQAYSATVELTASTNPQVFKLGFVTGGANINWMDFIPTSVSQGIDITQQPMPAEQQVNPGTPVSYVVSGHSDGSPISYQWYKDDLAIDNNGSANTPILNLGAVSHDDSGVYKVILTSDGQVETSDSVTLIVINSDLVITEQPQSVQLLAGEEAICHVSATGGDGPYNYQWYKQVDGNDTRIIGATDYQLVFPTVEEADEGLYFVVIDSNDGQQKISELAEITVISEVDAIHDVYLIDPDAIGTDINPGDVVQIRGDRFLLPNDLPAGEVILVGDTHNPIFKDFAINSAFFNNRKQNVTYRIEHQNFPDLSDSANIEVFHNTPLTQTDYVIACSNGIPINPLTINVTDLLANDKPRDKLKITQVTGASYDAVAGIISFAVSSDFCDDPNAREEISYATTLDVDWNPSVDNPAEAQTVVETVNIISQIPIIAVDLDYSVEHSGDSPITIFGETIFEQVINTDDFVLKFSDINENTSHGSLWSSPGYQNLDFYPDMNFWTRGYSTFTYTVETTGGGHTSSAQIRLLAVPETFDDVYIAQTPNVGELIQQQIVIAANELLHNDRPIGDVILLGVEDGAHGTAILSEGEIIYSPNIEFWLAGYDELTYQTTLDHHLPGVAEAKITVVADYSFFAGDDSYGHFPFGSQLITDLALNDWPADITNALIPFNQTSQFGGSISFQGSNTYWGYTPPGGSGTGFPVQGYDSFEYFAEINLQNETSEQVVGTVWLFEHEVPELHANPDVVSIALGATELMISTDELLQNDVGSGRSFKGVVRPPLYGKIYTTLNGDLRYVVPIEGQSGIARRDSFTYQMTDVNGRKSQPTLVNINTINFNLRNDIVLIEDLSRGLPISPSNLIQNDSPADQLTVLPQVVDTQYATIGINQSRPGSPDHFTFYYLPGSSFWLRGWDTFEYLATADNLPNTDAQNAAVTVVSVPSNVEHVFADSVEGGTLRQWSVNELGGGQLTATPDAAITGEFGLMSNISGYGQKAFVTDNTPDNEVEYIAQFLFDPNDFMTNNNTVALFRAAGDSGLALQLRIRSNADVYEIVLDTWDNVNQRHSTNWIPIENQAQLIRVDYKTGKAGMGMAGLKLDNLPRIEISRLTNDLKLLDSSKLGVINSSAETVLGSLLIDDFRSWKRN